MSAARVILELRWDSDWPGDDEFDLWLHGILGQALGKLKLHAVDEIGILEWERILEPGEKVGSSE
jgi:hypothetical protein